MNLYFDNAATSHPKPEKVVKAAENYLRDIGGNPGRGSHKNSLDAGRMLLRLREKLSALFNVNDPTRIAFTFNATDALNMAVKGFVKEGEHVIYTAMEHNSVLRSVTGLTGRKIITSSMIPCSREGEPDIAFLKSELKPETSLLVINHASNVCGRIMPIREMIAIAHRNGTKVLIDAAQTAGALPIDVQKEEIDMLAFCGHKSLLGYQGTGGLYVREGIDLNFWREGGTGSFSEKEFQPEMMPDRLEAGTHNCTGLAGLLAGVEFIEENGVDNIRKHEMSIREYLVNSLLEIPGIEVIGTADKENYVAVVSFLIHGLDCGEAGSRLDDQFGISCRTGLHCAPFAHRALGTFPEGTIRVSPGFFTDKKDIDYLTAALKLL